MLRNVFEFIFSIKCKSRDYQNNFPERFYFIENVYIIYLYSIQSNNRGHLRMNLKNNLINAINKVNLNKLAIIFVPFLFIMVGFIVILPKK